MMAASRFLALGGWVGVLVMEDHSVQQQTPPDRGHRWEGWPAEQDCSGDGREAVTAMTEAGEPILQLKVQKMEAEVKPGSETVQSYTEHQ
jgi:hypothetical protein